MIPLKFSTKRNGSAKFSIFLPFLITMILLLGSNPKVMGQFAGGSGSSSDPYIITNWMELDSVRNYTNDHFLLEADLDESSTGFGNYDPSKEWDKQTSEGMPIRSLDAGDDFVVGGGATEGEVLALNDDGTEKWTFEHSDAADMSLFFVDVNSIKVDNYGNSYVGFNPAGPYGSDDSSEVYKFSETGDSLWVYDGFRGDKVNDLVVDNSGHVYAGSNDHRVHKIDSSSGDSVWTYHHGSNVTSLAADESGYIYSGDNIMNEVHKINSQGDDSIWQWSAQNGVSALTVDDNGYLYVGTEGGKIHKLDTSSDYKWEYNGHGGTVKGLEAGPSGKVWSVDANGEVHKISPEGKQLRTYNGHSDEVNDITLDQNGMVYSGSSDGEIHKLSYGLEPIGGAFEGTFDGNGHIISHYTILNDNDKTGLFEEIHQNGTLKSLYIQEASVVQSNQSDNAGLLAGKNQGTISNIGVRGYVSAEGGEYLGGMVGKNSGIIEESYAYAITLKGKGGAVAIGGLTGKNKGSGQIENAFATGSLVADGDKLGGLTGHGKGAINNSYAKVKVKGYEDDSDDVGGLVGFKDGGTLKNAYSTGEVYGNSNKGGLLGRENGATVSDAYWDTEASNMNSSSGGSGKNTADMQDDAENELNFDFSDIWQVADKNRYPGLQDIERNFRIEVNGGEWSNPGNWEQKFPIAEWEQATVSPVNSYQVDMDKEVVVDEDIELKADEIILHDTLEFKSGKLEVKEGVLDITSNGGLKNEEKNAYFIGELEVKRDPQNDSTFGGIGVMLEDVSGSPGDITVTRESGPGKALEFDGNSGINRTWQFEPDGSITDADLTLEWVEDDDNNKNVHNMQVWKNEDRNGEWTSVGNLQDANQNSNTERSITVNISSFSYFTVSDDNNPLPVEWLNFEVALEEQGTNIQWSTASEIDNDYFMVQRRTKNSGWEDIEEVEGQGYSPNTTHYETTDKEVYQVAEKRVFYRVKQVDYDGTYDFSRIQYIQKDPVQEQNFEVHPNPFSDKLFVTLDLAHQSTLYITLVDERGVKIVNTSKSLERGKQKLNLDSMVEGLPKGLYYLHLRFGHKEEGKGYRLIKQ